jgi:hypothetical protein
MNPPVLLRDRPRQVQIVLAVIVPFVFGAVTGVGLGISAGAYWALSALAVVGGVLAGLEHRDWRGGARRGIVAGALFGLGVLIAHAITGADATVSLGGFPPLLIVIDAIIGMFLAALGGHFSQTRRRDEPSRPQSGP